MTSRILEINSRDLGHLLRDPSGRVKGQSNVIAVMGGGTINNNAQVWNPLEGSKEWTNLHGEETKKGGSPSPGPRIQPPTVISKKGTTGGSLGEILKMPEYHNPDPLVRLIGDANEAPAIVEGVPITSLVDSGACMSAMVKGFAKETTIRNQTIENNIRC